MPSAAASEPSATSTRLAVAPARSSLATERVMPSSARRAARWAGEPARAGSRADDDDAGAAPEPLQGRAEGGPQRLEVGRAVGGGQVDDDPAEATGLGHLVDERRPGGGQAVAQGGQGRGVGVAADEHRAVDERPPGHLAAQRHRLGQPERGGQLLAEAGGDERGVAVAVRHVRPPRGSRRRPGRRRRRSRSGPASPAPSRGAAWPGWRRCARRSRRTGGPAASDEPVTLRRERSMAPSGASRPSRSRQNSSSSQAARVESTVAANASWIS